MVYIIYAGSTKAKILILTINLQQFTSIIREIVISIKINLSTGISWKYNLEN